MIAKNEMISELGSTEVFSRQTHVCTNEKCAMYCGANLNEPIIVAAVTNSKVG